MTGPEHYREAERLIKDANQMQSDSGPGCGSEELLAEAQVHATLALAAAQAWALSPGFPGEGSYGQAELS